MCFSLLLGIPFVTVPGNSSNRSLSNLVGYCRTSLTCTYDEHVVSTLSKATTETLKEKLAIQHILYYGNSEPHVTIDDIMGSFCREDPISHVLQPTPKPKPKKRSAALWEYIPKNQMVKEYKFMMANTKGVGSEVLEKTQKKILEKCIEWREKGLLGSIMYVTGGETPRAMEHDTFESICNALQREMSKMLEQFTTRKTQVLIALPITDILFHIIVGFCIRNAYSFATVPNTHLSRHMTLYQPLVVIAHTNDILQLLQDIDQGIVQEFKGEGNVLDREQVTEIEFGYEGLLGNEGILQSNLLRHVRQAIKLTTKQVPLLGVVSVGHHPPIRSYPSVKHFYHITTSEDLQGPLECFSVQEQHASNVLDIWSDINHRENGVEINSTYVPKKCIKSVNENENESFNVDDIYDESKFEMPQDVRDSLYRLQQIKSEKTFYEQVLRVLRGRAKIQDETGLGAEQATSTYEQELYNALLDELDTVIPEHVFENVHFGDIEKYLRLRIELTVETERLQDIDFKWKFVNANREGKIKYKLKKVLMGPQLQPHDERYLIKDIIPFHGSYIPRNALINVNDDVLIGMLSNNLIC
jgi:hypothetical protein